MTRLLTPVVLALAFSAAAFSPSAAQSVVRPGAMMGMMGGGCPMIGMMGQGIMGAGMMGPGTWGPWGPGMTGRQPRMDAIVGGRLAYLEGELDITDAQTEAWKAYAEAVGARVDLMQGMWQSMIGAMRQGTAIERMDARIASMESMLEAMKALKPATEKLYAVLTDEQKKVADQLIGMDCGAM